MLTGSFMNGRSIIVFFAYVGQHEMEGGKER
jgi:hypothetical protein